jgi:hypothetical protein
MERLYRVMLLFVMVACWLNATPSLSAKDYCSLKVRVVTPDGRQFPVSVTVYEQSGRKIEKEQAPPHDLQFCDLGILPVKVVVGDSGCHEIVVRDVRNYWQEPYTLKVTYDPEHCMRELPPLPQPLCEVLFRISGSDGGWIDKAAVIFDQPSLGRLQTDSAGRALLVARLENRIRGSVSARGFALREFSIDCSKSGEYENNLTLTKK